MDKKGFTLIELLVVIAVIGILAYVVLASLNSARGKARDSKRLASVQQLTRALELYYTDTGRYPDVSSQNCTANGWSVLQSTLVPTYIPSLPTEGNYNYCGDQLSGSQEYVLYSQLENGGTALQNSFHGIFFTRWGGDDINCSSSTTYCVAQCRYQPGNEGPNEVSAAPNCGTY